MAELTRARESQLVINTDLDGTSTADEERERERSIGRRCTATPRLTTLSHIQLSAALTVGLAYSTAIVSDMTNRRHQLRVVSDQ